MQAREELDQDRQLLNYQSQSQISLHNSSQEQVRGLGSAQARPDLHASSVQPKRVEGLTEFLRKEYYRRMGIYLNGGRKEEGLLFNFWKDHVSEQYRKLREQQKTEQRDANRLKNELDLARLQRTDPNKYRRIMGERERKQKVAEEKALREQSIMNKTAVSFGPTMSALQKVRASLFFASDSLSSRALGNRQGWQARHAPSQSRAAPVCSGGGGPRGRRGARGAEPHVQRVRQVRALLRDRRGFHD